MKAPMNPHDITDPVKKSITEVIESLVHDEVPGLAEKLLASPDGKIGWSISLEVVKFDTKVTCSGSSAYKQTFKGEAESCVDLDDPANPPLLPQDEMEATRRRKLR